MDNAILLCFPATATGDLWHNAVSQICWQEFGSLSQRHRQHSLVSVFISAVATDGDLQLVSTGRHRAEIAYDYLQACGLPVFACKIRKYEWKVTGDDETKWALRRVGEESVRSLLALRNGEISSKRLGDIWELAPILEISGSGKDATCDIWDPMPVDTYAATTILCSYLHLGLTSETRQLRMTTIRKRLCASSSDQVNGDVRQKIAQLRHLRHKLCKGVQIVLYIYRKGVNFNAYNPEHDNSMGIFRQVQQIAAKHNKFLIRVPHGLHQDELLPGDFDLFDITSKAPMKEKTFTAVFWEQALHLPELFGVIGGRTGSLDIAALMGHRCFSFDEPLLHVLCSPETENRHSNEYVMKQLPQHFRFLQQCSIMSIGLLDASGWVEVGGVYVALREEPLRMWLDGEDGIRPRLPVTARAYRYLESACVTYLERPDLGILAVNLREMWRESIQRL